MIVGLDGSLNTAVLNTSLVPKKIWLSCTQKVAVIASLHLENI